MRFAKDRSTGQPVEASKARRSGHFVCAVCGGEAFLRAGGAREPHFAHFAGQGAPDCDEYHPGHFTGAGSSAATLAVEDSPESLGLALALQGENWQLLLRLPEIPADEFGRSSLQDLLSAHIAVSCGAVSIRVSAIDLRPGVSVAHALVPPSERDYTTRAHGHWPSGVALERWTASAPGLETTGTLFRLQTGEWTRLRAGSAVAWGERLTLIADEQNRPPDVVNPEPGGHIRSNGQAWQLWRVELPSTPNSRAATWLGTLGHDACMPPWRVRFMSLPVAYSHGGPQFAASGPVIMELIAPSPSARAQVIVSAGESAQSSNLNAPPRGRAYGELGADGPGRAILKILDDRDVTEELELVLEAPLSPASSDGPRLRVRIGNSEWRPWSSSEARCVCTEGEVLIELGVNGARLDLNAWLVDGQRLVRNQVTATDAVRIVEELLSRISLLEVDGGNFGRVRVSFVTSPVQQAADLPCSRLSPWLALVAAAEHSIHPLITTIGNFYEEDGRRRRVGLPLWAQVLARASARRTR